MSDAQHTEHEANHEGPIRTPKQLVGAVVASFVVPIAIIIMLANFVDFGARPGPAATAWTEADRQAHPAVGSIVLKRRVGPGGAAHRRAGLQGPVRGLPRHRRRRRPQAGRRRGLGAPHQDRLRRAAELGPEGQGRDGRRRAVASSLTWRLPRRGLHGQPGRRQVRRAQGRRLPPLRPLPAASAEAAARSERRPGPTLQPPAGGFFTPGSPQGRLQLVAETRAACSAKGISPRPQARLHGAGGVQPMSMLCTRPRPRSVCRNSRPFVQPAAVAPCGQARCGW
jgi:hypothetical protein